MRLHALAVLALTASYAHAAPKIAVVVGPESGTVERAAADDIVTLFKQLYEAEAAVSDTVPPMADHLILVGTPNSNPAVKAFAGDSWPKLGPEGHLLKSVTKDGRTALLIGGNTPMATMWAASELAHHFGVRSFLQGDAFPAVAPPLKLDGIEMLLEPAVQMRAWQVLGDSPAEYEAWGRADYASLFRQLAKLKFNRVVFACAPAQPFVLWEYKGVKKTSAALNWGKTFPIDADTPGRTAFKGAKQFENPDLAGKSDDERIAAGIDFVSKLMLDAREAGLSPVLGFSPTEFPPEFAAVVKDTPAEAVIAQARGYFDSHKAAHERFALTRSDMKADRFAEQLAAIGFKTLKPGKEIVPLSHAAVGVLPQHSLALLGRRKSADFLAVGGMSGDQSPAAYYLSRSAWTPNLTPKAALASLYTPILGPGAPERVLRGLEQIEQANELIAMSDPTFAVVAPDMVTKHFTATAPPMWWKDASKLYGEALAEMLRGRQNTRDGAARPLLFYTSKRCEFAVNYFAALEAARLSAMAKAKGDKDARLEQAEKAAEAMYNALSALGESARDPSDRGTIAVLTAYAYRPLKAELDAADKASRGK